MLTRCSARRAHRSHAPVVTPTWSIDRRTRSRSMSPAGGVITITGSTGRIGGLVARELAARGMPLRLVVREAARAPALAQAEIRTADYADAEAVQQALDGAGTVLMVSSTEAPDRLDAHRAFVDAAAAAGISHLVYTSFVAAAARATLTLARD